MKQTIVAALCGLWLAVLTVAFVQDPAVKSGKKLNTSAKPNAVKKSSTPPLASPIDPVCKMSVASGATETATHAGKQYGFCSKMCKERFQQHPTAYVR